VTSAENPTSYLPWTCRTGLQPIKDALCTATTSIIHQSAEGLSNGVYKLPRLADYEVSVEMDNIVRWPRANGMTPYMVHAHFRPLLRRVLKPSVGARYQAFYTFPW